MDSDSKLIHDIRKGDMSAFKTFFDSFNPVLSMFARRFLNGEEASKDIVQEAFLFFWKQREEIDSIDYAKALLYRFVKNRSLNYLRDKKPGDELDLLKMASEPYFRDSIIEEETYELIYKAIANLPPQSQRVIEMSLDGHKNKEIAKALNISVNTVKTIKQRAFRSLRNDLNDLVITFLLTQNRHVKNLGI